MNQLKIHTGKAGGALKVVVYGPENVPDVPQWTELPQDQGTPTPWSSGSF